MTIQEEVFAELEGVDDPVDFIKVAKELNKVAQLLPMIKDMFRFVEEVTVSGKPLMTEIRFNLTETDSNRMVSLWACVGNKTPTDRIKELLDENATLRVHISEMIQDRYKTAKSDA